MYELERKARADHRAIRARLTDLGLTPETDLVQADTYLNHPARDFAQTDEALRIRRSYPVADPTAVSVELTYKGPRLASETKTRVERTAAIDDRDAVRGILEALGFVVVDTVTKRRTRYEYDGVVICLDDVEGLGEFIEFEAQADTEPVEAAGRQLDQVVSELDLDTGEVVTRPYLTMLLEDETDDTEDAPSRSP